MTRYEEPDRVVHEQEIPPYEETLVLGTRIELWHGSDEESSVHVYASGRVRLCSGPDWFVRTVGE